MKRCENAIEYHVSRQEGARVTWHAANYETVDRTTILALQYPLSRLMAGNTTHIWRMFRKWKTVKKDYSTSWIGRSQSCSLPLRETRGLEGSRHLTK